MSPKKAQNVDRPENVQEVNKKNTAADHKEFNVKEESFDFKQEQYTQTIITEAQEAQRKEQAKRQQLLDINVGAMDPEIVLVEKIIALAKDIEVNLRQAMEDDHIEATDSQKNKAVKEVKKACNKALDKDEPVPDLHKTFHAVIPERRNAQFENTHYRLDGLKTLLFKIKFLSQSPHYNETLAYEMRKEFFQGNANVFDLRRSALLQNSIFAESYKVAFNRIQLRYSTGKSRADEEDDIENNNCSSVFSA